MWVINIILHSSLTDNDLIGMSQLEGIMIENDNITDIMIKQLKYFKYLYMGNNNKLTDHFLFDKQCLLLLFLQGNHNITDSDLLSLSNLKYLCLGNNDNITDKG